MVDYKTAKEAFVSDNPGSSIASINAVSLIAPVCYALYAILSRRARPSPLLDYLTSVLPLLLAVTIFSSHPYAFGFLLCLALAGTVLGSTNRSSVTAGAKGEKKSQGQWLDESDSDEEPAEPAGPGPTSNSAPPILLPSQVVAYASVLSSSSSSPTTPSDSLSPDSPRNDGPSRRASRRRHSPTPSTHSHMAINILPTPDLPGASSLRAERDDYPSPVSPDQVEKTDPGDQKLPFLSVYRAHMMIMTVHCILAVDFPVFPRSYGKCEDFGTSLMDVGVGSFVFSLGIVSIRSISNGPSEALLPSLLKSLWKSAPILTLGFLRVLMVKSSEYPEHVTEYGVHWNFFFTMGLLPAFGVFLRPIADQHLRWVVLGVLLSSYQGVALASFGLETWVMSPSRLGLIGMNKEGLVSLPGYFSIYILGLATGQHILRSAGPAQPGSFVTKPPNHPIHTHYVKRRTELALELFSYTTAWWTVLLLLRAVDYQVSRRLANLPYILWIAAYNTTFLLLYLLVEIFLFPLLPPRQAVPPLLEAINDNSLAVFLVANLLTGLVNISMRTMYAGTGASMAVLIAYSIGVSGIAWMSRGVRLKIS